jgi:hypothetical protein
MEKNMKPTFGSAIMLVNSITAGALFALAPLSKAGYYPAYILGLILAGLSIWGWARIVWSK